MQSAAEPWLIQQVGDKLRAAAVKLGVELPEAVVRSQRDIDAAVRQAKEQGAHALYVQAGTLAYGSRKQIADAALAHRLPASVFFSEDAEAGALMSYSASLPDHFRLAALYVDKLLRAPSRPISRSSSRTDTNS